jgi:hypothetical protein
MTASKRRFVLLLTLLTLFVSVVLADYHHSEKSCKADPACPACRFQNSSLTVSTVHFFHLPGLRFLAFVEPGLEPAEIDAAPVAPSSRAPPQA